MDADHRKVAKCAGGDHRQLWNKPAKEAAEWVDYANNVKHYGIKYWMISNEQYFPLPGYDPDPFDPAAYAAAVANKFYPLMKAKDPSIKIGINMTFGNAYNWQQWDPIVLMNAKFDFVEMHYCTKPLRGSSTICQRNREAG